MRCTLIFVCLLGISGLVRVVSGAPDNPALGLHLKTHLHEASGTEIRAGSFGVYEDRERGAGRVLRLDVVVLPATGARRPDPVFILSGGPGVSAAQQWRQYVSHWMREHRDIVLVSQRGTGGNNRLLCPIPGAEEDPQRYLEPYFDAEMFRSCLEDLAARFDLRHYSTSTAMDDLDDIRAALGYETINLYGGSYASRAILVYLRRHAGSARCAVLNSVAPISFTNPLYHAWAAERTLGMIIDECAADPACNERFGDLRATLDGVLADLEEAPAPATVTHPVTGALTRVLISRDGFAEAVRFGMYTNISDVPLIIDRAAKGEFDLIAQRGVDQARWIESSLASGMLLCVTCGEDVSRIDPADIDELTRDTFLGDSRVRRQMAICEFWPDSIVPEDYGLPVAVDTPVLLFSGTHDAVTPPRWGEEAARHLPNSLHVIAPGTHGLGGPCVDGMMRNFLESGSVDGLDTSCVESMRLPPYSLRD